MNRTISLALGFTLVVSGCGQDPPDGNSNSIAHRDLELGAEAVNAWEGLSAPTGIAVAESGDIIVPDEGDGQIHVFGPRGTPRNRFGGSGDGPGEYRRVRALAPHGDTLDVFDANPTRYLRFLMDGSSLGPVKFAGGPDQQLTRLGPARFVGVSNSRWSMQPPEGRRPWPLAEVLDQAGNRVTGIGSRDPQPNPLVASIANFMLPAGSNDGQYVWLTFLNRPDVILYSTSDATLRRRTRALPFPWRQLGADLDPSALVAKAGRAPQLPFDVITYGVAVDRAGNAYVLTALESSQAAGGGPTRMAVDMIAPKEGLPMVRFSVDGHYSHIAVSPSGDRVYLLNVGSGVIRSFTLPRA